MRFRFFFHHIVHYTLYWLYSNNLHLIKKFCIEIRNIIVSAHLKFSSYRVGYLPSPHNSLPYLIRTGIFSFQENGMHFSLLYFELWQKFLMRKKKATAHRIIFFLCVLACIKIPFNEKWRLAIDSRENMMYCCHINQIKLQCLVRFNCTFWNGSWCIYRVNKERKTRFCQHIWNQCVMQHTVWFIKS